MSPADHLVQLGLQMLDAQGSVDNITAVVVLFKPGGAGAASVTKASGAAGGGGGGSGAKGGQ